MVPYLISLHNGKPISWENRYQLSFEIASGVNAIHQKKILHRDLKSLNVVLDGKGHAKITDFGFAKMREQISLSQSRKSKERQAYKAPELYLFEEEEVGWKKRK